MSLPWMFLTKHWKLPISSNDKFLTIKSPWDVICKCRGVLSNIKWYPTCNIYFWVLKWLIATKSLTWYFFPLISTGFPFGPIQNISWGPADRQVNNAFPPVVWKYISDHWWIFGLVGLWQVVSVSKPKKKRGVKLKFVSNKKA